MKLRTMMVRAAGLMGVTGLAVGCSSAPGTTTGEPTAATEQSLGAEGADVEETPEAPVVINPTSRACADLGDGAARCHALYTLDADGRRPSPAASPSGYGPADLQSAYKLPSTGGTGMTVALVDAYDYANAEADLAVYRSHYGLPACTTANGCFKRVNQSGQQGNYPGPNAGWNGEAALDLDMVSAACPNCKIILVEATSATGPNLDASNDTAVALGANAVSNSWGGGESASDATNQHYNHPGVIITASSGDNGYGPQFPAGSQYVTAVGGTHLVKKTGPRGWHETAWNGAGSGCSKFSPKPSWQHDTACAKRTIADVSAVADPNTGVATYHNGWVQVGGTSVSSPLVAAIFALAGTGLSPSTPYAHTAALYDVVRGTNGSCGGSYLCTAGVGYDGPTGLGSPHGIGAF